MDLGHLPRAPARLQVHQPRRRRQRRSAPVEHRLVAARRQHPRGPARRSPRSPTSRPCSCRRAPAIRRAPPAARTAGRARGCPMGQVRPRAPPRAPAPARPRAAPRCPRPPRRRSALLQRRQSARLGAHAVGSHDDLHRHAVELRVGGDRRHRRLLQRLLAGRVGRRAVDPDPPRSSSAVARSCSGATTRWSTPQPLRPGDVVELARQRHLGGRRRPAGRSGPSRCTSTASGSRPAPR